jgi:hypothetical protein
MHYLNLSVLYKAASHFQCFEAVHDYLFGKLLMLIAHYESRHKRVQAQNSQQKRLALYINLIKHCPPVRWKWYASKLRELDQWQQHVEKYGARRPFNKQ